MTSRITLFLLLALLLTACMDGTIELEPVWQPSDDEQAVTGLVVVGSDYESTTLSVIAAETGVLQQENFLHSGSTTPGLSTTFSGDVAAASTANPDGSMVIIDRWHSVVTWISPDDLSVTAQMNVGDAGYGVNPADYLAPATDKAYISRAGQVLDESGDVASGDDLLIINPQTREELGSISLTEWAAPSPGTTTTYAHPTRLLEVDGHIYVLLQNLDGEWMNGEAVVAVVDMETDTVATTLTVEGIRNCGDGVHDADNSRVILACSGGTGMLAESAIVLLDVSDPAAPAVAEKVQTETFSDHRLKPHVALLGGSRVVTATYGASDFATGEVTAQDEVFILDLDADAIEKELLAEGAPYTLSLFVDRDNLRIYIADAAGDAPAIEVVAFDAESDAVHEENTIEFSAALPPRDIAGY